jgi:hypothetical protein
MKITLFQRLLLWFQRVFRWSTVVDLGEIDPESSGVLEFPKVSHGGPITVTYSYTTEKRAVVNTEGQEVSDD